VAVDWTVAADPDLRSVVASGSALASPEGDHTVHVEAGGLEPGTVYWYGFAAGRARSPVGRTRTAPSGPVARLRIGVVCCAHWTAGFFNAYGRLAERDVDLIVHLGDYLYEDDSHHSRRYRAHEPPGRVSTLAGYRARYAQYRTDPDLQRLHHRHPVVAVWDDHELAGNSWWGGAARHVRRTDGDWAARREAATRAYLEWLPLRRPDPADPLRLWRRIDLGGLCDLIVLDTRLVGRERPAAGRRPVLGIWRRGRSLLGEAQRRWLAAELSEAPGSGPAWRLLASQVVVAPIHFAQVPARLQRFGRLLGMVGGGVVINPGQWDGYPDERDRLIRLLAARGGDTVVVSGDLHSSWASELAGAGGEPVAVEVVAPSVSAPSFAVALGRRFPGGRRALEGVIRKQNPHVGFVETAGHGYLLLEITPDRIEAQWWHVDTVRRRQPGEHLAGAWSVSRGRPRLVSGPVPPGG
jgi:alkaline phosphatase D